MKKRQRLTVIIPTKDEEHNIKEVLQSVSFADEIIVVDSFSTDKTAKIAKEYTDFILQREYKYSASQKNWAIPQAKNTWILLVDADERVSPELQKEIINVLENNPKENAFWIFRKNYFMGKHMKHGGLNTDKVIRLFKRDTCKYENKYVHAEIITHGKVGVLANKLSHNTYVTLDKYIEKKNRYASWSALDYIEKNNKVRFVQIILKSSWRFHKHYFLQRGFLDGIPGLVYAFLESYGVFMRYIKIWLMKRNMK